MADLVRRRVRHRNTRHPRRRNRGQRSHRNNTDRVWRRRQPVKLGLVTSLARPGGNATGINFFAQEITAKRLGLLHEMAPMAARVGVLVNPTNVTSAEATLQEAQDAARALGLQIQVLKASTSGEVNAAFDGLARATAEALLVVGDGFLVSRRVQIAICRRAIEYPLSTRNVTMSRPAV